MPEKRDLSKQFEGSEKRHDFNNGKQKNVPPVGERKSPLTKLKSKNSNNN